MIDNDVVIANQELRKSKRVSPRVAGEKSPFMSFAQVLELVPVGRSTLRLMIAAEKFPQPKKLGTRAAAWSKAEVEAWINDKLK